MNNDSGNTLLKHCGEPDIPKPAAAPSSARFWEAGMTDRELLEMAAKAAGIELRWWDNSRNGLRVCNGTGSVCKRRHWNPIEDDRDALRLAVKLSMEVYHGDNDGPAVFAAIPKRNAMPAFVIEMHGNDPYTATRRAITRAAAEIGKAMP